MGRKNDSTVKQLLQKATEREKGQRTPEERSGKIYVDNSRF